MTSSSKFRVIIVGGSVAGLTLAHCLHRAGIDYIVLEKGNQIAPELGASIGIMPNGARILEQLGLLEHLERCAEPLNVAQITFPDGFAVESQYPQVLHQRFGFPLTFLTRREFLRIVYETHPNKSNILTNKRVTEVRRLHNGICAATDDGSVYEGGLIVGADGVHSRIRSEIWRWADEEFPGAISAGEKASMTVEYACVFGISSGVRSLKAGAQINAFLEKAAIITVHGMDGRVFWFLFKKLDRKHVYPAVPRFSTDDAVELCNNVRDVHLYKGLRFGDIWKNREIASMTALEEGLFKSWFYDRMVLVGDSVHKMTPNFGQGANCSIEDAASLASLLRQLLLENNPRQPADAQIRDALQAYQNMRYPRVRRIYDDSWTVCRFHARDNVLYRLVGRYYTPYAPNLPADLASKAFADGDILQFLPLPVRSGPGWALYGRNAGYTALPYVMLFVMVALVVQRIV
ncbi:FAD-dependent oxidoreductase [Aspergillus lucknowensis]|uniref:FAD-binding domain-containing protein n=1 Tax=Aspergillus lucknowensis TaxID=176173 RepID=A0ABR4M2Y1_9EURO